MNYSILVMCRFYYYISSTIHLLLRSINFTLFVFDFESNFQFEDLKQLAEEPCLITGLDYSQSITIFAMGSDCFVIAYFNRLLAAIFECYLFNYLLMVFVCCWSNYCHYYFIFKLYFKKLEVSLRAHNIRTLIIVFQIVI